MNAGESKDFQEGNARDAEERRIVLDVDLNNPPPGKLMDPTNHPEVVKGQGNGNSGGQAAAGAEATQNSRRPSGIPPDDDCLRLSDLFTSPVEEREFNLELETYWNIEGHN